MPIDVSTYTQPQEPIRQILPENYYIATIKDITSQVTENKFNPEVPRQQFVVDLVVAEGEYKDTEVRTWVNDSLMAQTKAKNPDATLPKLLKALTGKVFGPADRSSVTPEFINTLIGSRVRVNIKPFSTKDGNERNVVVSFSQAA